MKYFRFVLLLILLTSCGAVVNTDYDKRTDFKIYKTYNYFSDIKSGFNQLDDRRLMRAIDSKLKTMGLEKTEETPSFLIDIQSALVNSNPNSNVGVGIGGTGRNVGGGLSIGIPVGGNRELREIRIEFVDDSKNGTFWEAVTTVSNLGNTPEKREQSFIQLVERVFKNYPPKQ